MIKTDNILITGAGGFIGSHLVEELSKRGYRVRAFLKKGESDENIRHLIGQKNVEIIRGDLLDKSSLKKACKGMNFVFHLAAKVDLATKSYLPYKRINVEGTKNLVESCDKSIRKFIFFSSMLAVGLPNTKKKITEKYIGNAQSFYGQSKRESEEYLKSEFNKRKFPYVILRPTSVYGPRELIVLSGLFKVINMNLFVMVGNGKNLVSYVYVKNMINAAIGAAFSKKTIGQVYFISDARPYKFEELIKEIYLVLGKKYNPIKIPFLLAYIGSFFVDILAKLLGKKALIYPSRVKTLVLNYPCSIKKAITDFGYSPKFTLKQGLAETHKWYVENRHI